jgi:hypothetical protein
MEDILKNAGPGWESTENKFYNAETIPACNPENDCNTIQDLLGEEDGSYDEYLRIKRDALRSILYEEDRIQELMSKLKEHMLIIKNCKEEIDSAFTKYISIQWQ